MEWIVRRIYKQGRQISMLHELTAEERPGELRIAEEHDELRHRHARVARLMHQGVEQIPPLWDYQLVGASGSSLSLVGIERDQSRGGSPLQYGQTWLLRPAPRVEHERELARLRAAMSDMAGRLHDSPPAQP